jgi:hypothetical protein
MASSEVAIHAPLRADPTREEATAWFALALDKCDDADVMSDG